MSFYVCSSHADDEYSYSTLSEKSSSIYIYIYISNMQCKFVISIRILCIQYTDSEEITIVMCI